MKLNKLFSGLGLASILLLGSCSDDFLNRKQGDFTTGVEMDTILSNSPAALDALVRGIQGYLVSSAAAGTSSHDDFGIMAILHSGDMMADDMVLVKNGSGWFMYDQDLSNGMDTYRRTRIQWYTLYTLIAKSNDLINRLDEKNAAHAPYLAQAYAYRSYAYYYLIQFYQHTYKGLTGENAEKLGVPIMLSKKETSIRSRAKVKEVFDQIEKDILKSISFFESTEWKRPDKNFISSNVAYGIAARYYLMTEQWQKALDMATKALVGQKLMSAEMYLAGFSDIKNDEWMWGMTMDNVNTTVYASFFSMVSNVSPGYAGINQPRAISKRLYVKIPAEDMRKRAYGVDSILNDKGTKVPNPKYLFNYKFGYEDNFQNDYPYMRAAEMYLIKAEAEAQLGQTADAAKTLNTLLTQRYSTPPALTTVTVEDVLLQRRIELWGEGFSLFDLKRTNTPILRQYTGTNFQAAYQYNAPIQNGAFLLQIPLVEMTENPAIKGQQNPTPPTLKPGNN